MYKIEEECSKGFKAGPPIILYNVILPMLFLEMWSVIAGFLVVVIIEAIIIKYYLNEQKISRLFVRVFKVNFFTTIIGYLAQGVIRIVVLFILMFTIGGLWESSNVFLDILMGLLGNAGLQYQINSLTQIPLNVAVDLLTSFIIAFWLSVIVETRVLQKYYKDDYREGLVPRAILAANLASYCLLFGFIIYQMFDDRLWWLVFGLFR